ncbi:hypothetical protein CC1G_01255 [Coprinopsis cinerea okayama7|uniref:DUF4187 domain-containing protein n=1 Tax=Coprinopsis cinerea (strain Okayama-7 / 130 / ATCC MYA-4618 / FGSC 9003) TaxID=240176 RepID=A8NY49_COPC7|nr:hypothetical protein CC1G_01255 [Coprinopsis cinerea okayama7\|eukprot:XP_001837343.1 hypothetical protein CC1G_01255 [Coprinopsis cinerea okayama7\
MSSDEDDYLSAKFLTDIAPDTKSTVKTYSQIRKDAEKRSHLKQERNRIKSRREREVEAREEGLSKSLFERAKEEEEAGLSSNKALSMMMKMGFKPGQSLGARQNDDEDQQPEAGASRVSERGRSSTPLADSPASGEHESTPNPQRSKPHLTEPLPVLEWKGKQGIGLGKRARSPDAAERLAKIAKLAEQADQRDFRERARENYNNRRAEGRLGPAQRTCATLDEQMGKEFNVLWLNPENENTFPPGLIDALALHSNLISYIRPSQGSGNSSAAVTDTEREGLKRQMQADALVPLRNDEDDDGTHDSKAMKSLVSSVDQFSTEILEEATQFLRLQAQDRLRLVLSYLRSRHNYCFWCGIKYENEDEIANQCPGPEEDDHD